MAIHSIPSSGGAFTRRLDAGLASASTILFEKFFLGDIRDPFRTRHSHIYMKVGCTNPEAVLC
jgi:hypothetical protein